jgi:hypothetical protein
LFVVDANPNISVFGSLMTYSLFHVLGKHGSPLPLVAELASALFLTNSNDKVYHAFRHLEEVATSWCNSEVGDVFLKGSFQQFHPPTQKPYGLKVEISNCLVVCNIMLSANDDGQAFSKSMEVLQKYAHGVSAVQGHRILWMLSNVGCIITNDYMVGAEMSLKLAKQVFTCVHCSTCGRFHHKIVVPLLTVSSLMCTDQAKVGRVLEFVADIANNHNLSLVELTVFTMVVNHKSLTVRTSVCNMWSTYLDKVNQKESYTISQECLRIFNCLISEYLNGVGELESYAIHPTKKARVGKGSLVPKSVFIESSIHSSNDDTASFNASIKELPEFRQRTSKIGYIVIDLQSIFDTAFPNVKIRPISRVIRGGNKKTIKIWQATGTRVNRGEKMMLYPGHMPMMPKSYLTLKDHSTWYYNKAMAVKALMWYNLTTEANTDWRNRRFHHLLGSESEVSLRRSKFPEEDALVRLFISRKSKSNKKTFVLSYPDD